MRIRNIIHFLLKPLSKNEQGFVFVYLLTILLIVTTILLHHLSLQHIQTENLLLIQEQHKIQQFMQIAQHDLQEILDLTRIRRNFYIFSITMVMLPLIIHLNLHPLIKYN